MEELKNKIRERIESEQIDSVDQQEIFEEIKNLSNEEERKEVLNFFVKKIAEESKKWNLAEEDLKENIAEVRENLKMYAGLTDIEIDDLFRKNKFSTEEILGIQAEKEIDKIEKRIEELTEQLEQENQQINVSKKNKTTKQDEYETLKKQIELVELNPEDNMYPEFEQDKKRLAELEKEIENSPENKAAKIKAEYEALKKQIELVELNPEDNMYPEFEQDKKRLAELEKEIENLPENKAAKLKAEYEALKKQIELVELNPEDNMYPEFEQDKKRLAELEKEIENLPENKATKLKAEYEALKKQIELVELNPEDNMYPEFEQDKKRLAELEKELIKLEEEMSGFKGKNENIINELKELQQIKEAYNKIKNDAITKYNETELEETELKGAIDKFVNEHELTAVLNNYENADKLKAELKEDIYNNVKVKKVEKVEKNTKLLYKSLAGCAGFAAGLAASAVPGVGTIRMGIAATKLAASAINVWTKKHPEGKIAGLKNNFKENHPKITSGIEKMKEKIKSDPLKWAINGFAAGYIAGNVIELATGKSLFEHLKPETIEKPELWSPSDDIIAQHTGPVAPELPELPELNPGEVYDISALGEGYTSSYSDKAVKLMEEVGKTVEVDQFNVVNGEQWVHFKQLDGKGYAWFKVKDVQEVLAKAAETTASKTL